MPVSLPGDASTAWVVLVLFIAYVIGASVSALAFALTFEWLIQAAEFIRLYWAKRKS